MLFYAGFAVINGLFRPVGHFVSRNLFSLRQAASEDFAVTFEFLITGNGEMQKVPVRGDWMAKFIEGNKRTRPAYAGSPYQYLWFSPQPIPVPECSLPRVLVTPQP